MEAELRPMAHAWSIPYTCSMLNVLSQQYYTDLKIYVTTRITITLQLSSDYHPPERLRNKEVTSCNYNLLTILKQMGTAASRKMSATLEHNTNNLIEPKK